MRTVLCSLLIALYITLVPAQERALLSVHSDTGTVRVYLDTLFLGKTPLDSVAIEPGNHIVRFLSSVERDWYQIPVVETLTVTPGEHLKKSVKLSSARYSPYLFRSGLLTERFADNRNRVPAKALEGKIIPDNTSLYLTTAGAVLSGAVAAYFKLQADNYYTKYQYNGDQSLLDKVKRNDTFAGIALTVCEINLVLLTYLLLSR